MSAAGQALALVGLRWRLWQRRFWQERPLVRGALLLVTLGAGGALSLSLAALVLREATRLSRRPVEVEDLGGPLAIAAAWLTLGFLLRLYFAVLAIGRGAPFLDARRFLAYAVPPRLVTAINVAAQLAEPGWLFFYAPALALAVGVARIPGAPPAWALLSAVAALILATAAVFHLALALLAEISARRWLRRGFLLLVLAGGVLLARRPDLAKLVPDGSAAWALLSALPSGWAASLAAALAEGRAGAALRHLLALGAMGALATLLAHRLSLREARRAPEVVRATGPARGVAGWRLPWLPDAVAALVEKEVKTVLRAGWQQLLAAPVSFVFLRFAASQAERPLLGPAPLLVAAVYAHLGVLAYATNAFGWDADGARGIFLWPLRGRAVLAAKNAVAYAASLLLFLGLALLSAAGGRLQAGPLLLALAAHAATFPLLAALGNASSIFFPVPLRGARLKRTVGAGPALLRVATLALLALGAWAPWALARATGRSPLALYLGELLVMAVAQGGLLAASEALLALRREPFLRALKADE